MITAYQQLALSGRTPTAKETAKQSGYALRSLYERFGTVEILCMAAFEQATKPGWVFGAEEASLSERSTRIEHHVRARANFCAKWHKLWQVANAVATDTSYTALTNSLANMRKDYAAWLRLIYRPDLESASSAGRQQCLAMLIALTSFESWNLLRGDFGLAVEEIKDGWRSTIAGVLPPP